MPIVSFMDESRCTILHNFTFCMINIVMESPFEYNTKEGNNAVTQSIRYKYLGHFSIVYSQSVGQEERSSGKKGAIKRRYPAGNNDSLMTYYPHITSPLRFLLYAANTPPSQR